MKLAAMPVGPRGIALLGLTAAIGLVLAVHGWSGRHSGLPPGALAGGSSAPAALSSSAPAALSSSSPAATVRPGPSAGPASSPGPAATPGTPSAAPSASLGPLLSTQSFAPYSYRVWPGNLNAAARAALTGLSVSVHRQGSGISVAAGVTGQAGTARFYPQGATVYIIEASLGDDSGHADYDMGDDGLAVTNAQGRILQ